MRAVVQRVSKASVWVQGEQVSAIANGLLVLLGVETDDGLPDVQYMAHKISTLRVFSDGQGKMNLSLPEIKGALLLISQFTLLGDARKGRRPSYIQAEQPERAERLFWQVKQGIEQEGIPVKTGVFGADMQVSLVNDGPVTLLLDSHKRF